jgi:sugar lactone lactonase YvrE
MLDGVIMRNAERLTRPFAYHGEGPFWDSRRNRLLCVDVFAGTVVAVDSVGDICRYPVGTRAATVVRFRARSGFVIATENGLVVAHDDLVTFEPMVELVHDTTVRTNDGGCDPLGGFVVGTMDCRGRPGRGAVYRVAPDRQVTELLAPVSISNGVQWSADGTKVFYIDTPSRRVDVFDVDSLTGTWSDRRTHIDLGGITGFPDGMAIDEDGGLWIALWGGGAVNHYDGLGRLAETITVPGVSQVSSCTFGGDLLSTLYITTSRQDLPEGDEPDAGAVYAVQTSVRGAVAGEFAG